jgi:hypothetical protein
MEATDVMWTATWGSFTRLPLSQGISNAGSVTSWFAPDDVKKRWGCTVSHCQSQRREREGKVDKYPNKDSAMQASKTQSGIDKYVHGANGCVCRG